tara:strand:- start:11113 stop:11748 length:636 start_codon:yes stop_codon:yes gene_type:complete
MINVIKTFGSAVKYWYIPLIVGILFIALGIYVFTVPVETYVTLSYLFSISFIVFGLAETFFSVSNRKSLSNWGWFLVGGILNLLIGIYLIANPGISVLVLPLVVGFTMLFRSFQGLGFAFDLKDYGILKWGNFALLSVLGILFSFGLIMNPIFTGLTLVSLTATVFILLGILGITFSIKLKKVSELPSKIDRELKQKIENIHQEIENSMKK